MIVAVVVIIIIFALGIFLFSGGASPRQVTITGTVTTTSYGTHPSGLTFTDQYGNQYSASLTTSSSDSATYYVTVPNDASYSVTVYWTGLLGVSGHWSGGSVSVYVGVGQSTTIYQDFSG